MNYFDAKIPFQHIQQVNSLLFLSQELQAWHTHTHSNWRAGADRVKICMYQQMASQAMLLY